MKKRLLVLLLQFLIVSAAFAQTHKSKHPVAHKKHTTAAHTTKHKTGTAGKTATKHKTSARHKTASKHGHPNKHGNTASRGPVKRNVHETALLQPNMQMLGCDSLKMLANDTSSGAISFLLSILTSELGKPYRFGSDGPTSFDCSGLINYAFSYLGISLPRSSSDISQLGKLVMMKDLVPGDLLFFTGSRQSRRRKAVGHLGCVYKVDSGKVYMIHSSNEGVNITNISESEYYKKRLIYAKRVLGTDSVKKKKK